LFEQLGWYVSIFLGLFFTGIGIPPVPEEFMIASAAAITAANDQVHWWLAWPAVILGILCADTTLYWIGRRWGRRLFKFRWVKKLIKEERRQRLEVHFAEHGMKILLTARLLPPLRTGVFMVAGAVRYPYPKFLAADAIYAVVGVGLFFFGSQWLISLLMWAGHWAVYAAGGGIAVFLLYRYYRHLRARELRGTAEPPASVLEMPPPPVPSSPAPTAEGSAGSAPAVQREAAHPSS